MRAALAVLALCACSTAGKGGPDPACDDGARNGDESDVDCGGSCAACGDGAVCAVGTDCESKVCNSVCAAPSCSDGVQNGGELGLDCGGVCPPVFGGIGCVNG